MARFAYLLALVLATCAYQTQAVPTPNMPPAHVAPPAPVHVAPPVQLAPPPPPAHVAPPPPPAHVAPPAPEHVAPPADVLVPPPAELVPPVDQAGKDQLVLGAEAALIAAEQASLAAVHDPALQPAADLVATEIRCNTARFRVTVGLAATSVDLDALIAASPNAASILQVGRDGIESSKQAVSTISSAILTKAPVPQEAVAQNEAGIQAAAQAIRDAAVADAAIGQQCTDALVGIDEIQAARADASATCV